VRLRKDIDDQFYEIIVVIIREEILKLNGHQPSDEDKEGHFYVFIVTSPRLNRINSILIPLSCNLFSGSPSAKNSRVKRAWPGAISGWVTDRQVFPGAQSEDKSAQKRLGLVCRARV
jgi:hypothetical protein